jgi:histidinol-phosphatase (PHP family)
MALPADGHVHSEWSWDTAGGSMERSCERAVAIGLPAIAFTEHLDQTALTISSDAVDAFRAEAHLSSLIDDDGVLTPPAFDAAGYLESIERCRERFPDLRILSGLEIGEPHRHGAAVASVLASGTFDRILGSLHCLPIGDGFAEPPGLYERRGAADVVRDYFLEIAELVSASEVFSVLAHIDYPLRTWPTEVAGPFDLTMFEDELRHALRATAQSGRALEINTKTTLDAMVLRWWREVGGDAVVFGSDAHHPEGVARGFREAAAIAEAHGFRPANDPYAFWGRAA